MRWGELQEKLQIPILQMLRLAKEYPREADRVFEFSPPGGFEPRLAWAVPDVAHGVDRGES